jgi:hypothetical protein
MVFGGLCPGELHVTFRHFLKKILRPVPGFAGVFQRREQLLEHARSIESMRAQSAEQNGAIESLRSRLEEQGDEIASLRDLTNQQGSEIASLRTRAEDQAGEIASQRDQLAAIRAEAAAREAKRAAALRIQWKDVPHLEKQGLFVVGHARSGTSILLRALNSSPDIFLLGEANLYIEGLRSGFPRWFNEMHQQFGNTLAKDSYCPTMADPEANGPETFQWLGHRFRYVGEKVAFRSETLGYNPAAFFDFHARHFFTSHYVCVIRNPSDVLQSNNHMFKPENLAIYADSYLQSLQLILELVDTFPNVLVASHESIDQATFETIGQQLGVDLKAAFALYEGHYQREGRWGPENAHLPLIDTLIDVHRRVRDVFSPDTLRPLPGRELRKLPGHLRALRTEAAVKAASP